MQIVIDGEPIGQARMRHRYINGISMTYDPQAKQKKKLKEYFKSLNLPTYQHPKISVIAYHPIPKSTRKKDLALYTSGLLKHEKKPDIDNILKFLLDCLDGIAFDGDQKVSLGTCIKLYSDVPRVLINIKETSPTVQPVDLHDVLSDKESSNETACLHD
jgi:Holliday junction resolvase RusA-like endonuclease